MSEKRKELVNRIIRLYGHENPITIQFTQMCEEYDANAWNEAVLNLLVEAHEFAAVCGVDE